MGYQVKDIIVLMEEIAPARHAEYWDNVGLIVGDSTAAVNRIMVTLDITRDVIQDAIEKQVNLIISHHPIIFKPIKMVNDHSVVGSQILLLLQSGISVYCAHTNLDKAEGGVDDTLAHLLGLQEIQPLTQETFGRIGRLSKRQLLKDYLLSIKETLGASSVDFIGDPNKEIQVVASCAGAGGDFICEAQSAGAELFITGEIKYHDAISTMDGDMAVAAFGHYATEMPAMTQLIRRLQKSVNALQYKIEVIPPKYYGDSFCRLKE